MIPMEPARYTMTGAGFAERWYGDLYALTGEMGALDAPDLIPSGSVAAHDGLLVPFVGVASTMRGQEQWT
jgi:hypothetical protein